MFIDNDKEKIFGLNDYLIIEKQEENSNMICSRNNKDLLSKGKILSGEILNKSTFIRVNSMVLYIDDGALQISGNIYAIKKDFIVATTVGE